MTVFDLSAFEAPLEVPQLQTGPALLRPFAASDLPLIRQAATDPYIPLVTSIPSTYSDDGGRAFIERQQSRATDGHGYSFVIAEGSDPARGLGGLGLWLHEIESGRASIGYWVAPGGRGKNLAGWGLRGAVGFAFDVLAIPRLHLFIEPWNIASQRTAEFADFSEEALLRGWERINGVQRDVYSYVLFRQGWNAPTTGAVDAHR
jgi:[ribosomal protein S5]-alanine N-acetyltransferase